jgi:hypothetical protein
MLNRNLKHQEKSLRFNGIDHDVIKYEIAIHRHEKFNEAVFFDGSFNKDFHVVAIIIVFSEILKLSHPMISSTYFSFISNDRELVTTPTVVLYNNVYDVNFLGLDIKIKDQLKFKLSSDKPVKLKKGLIMTLVFSGYYKKGKK